jgi:DNA invertase Pin-like site-specific DNA recombinase
MHTPLHTSLSNRQVIGFIRVSTRRQAVEGLSLKQQEVLIREYVVGNGGDLRAIYGGHASGMGNASVRNHELRDILKLARDTRAILAVTDVTRLGRSITLVDLLDVNGVEVLVVDEGRILSREELRRRLLAAERHGLSISQKTTEALASAKKRGVKLGNRTNLRHAQCKGQLASRIKKDIRIEEVVRILRRHDPKLGMTASEAAKIVNLAGLRTGKGNRWTRERMLPLLRKARAYDSSRWYIGPLTA